MTVETVETVETAEAAETTETVETVVYIFISRSSNHFSGCSIITGLLS